MTDPLEAQLRSGGEKVAEGVFRIDARRAMAKLREYRLAEPHHWILEVLRAATGAGADTVEITTDTDDVILRFDGKPFAAAAMKDLLNRALDSSADDARRHVRSLSLGIAGALGLQPKWIKVRSGKVALEIKPPDAVSISECDEKGTVVHVRKRFGWAVVKNALTDVTPEEKAVDQRALRYPPTLKVNKKVVKQRPLFKGGLLNELSFKGDGMDLVVGLDPYGPGGHLVFDVDGVEVSRRLIELPVPFVNAWARCDRMRRNASGSDVVDSDPAVNAVIKKVRQLSLEVTAKLQVEGVWRAKYREYMTNLWLGSRIPAEARAILSDFKVIQGLHNTWHSPAEFVADEKLGRPIYFTRAILPRGSHPPRVALLDSDDDPVRRLLPPKNQVDAQKLVRRIAQVAETKERWLESPVESCLVPEHCLTRTAISQPGVVGELGLVDRSHAPAFVRLLCKGRFIQQGEVAKLEPLRLHAVVDLTHDLSDQLWAELPTDKVWAQVIPEIEEAFGRAVLPEIGSPAFAAHARDWIIRLARAGKRLEALPPALRDAPVLPTITGAPTSFNAMRDQETWWWTSEKWGAPLLSGEPVLLLEPELHAAMLKLNQRRMTDARDLLEQEREIREKIAAPKTPATLSHATVKVPIDGFTGEVGITAATGSELHLLLLRNGVRLEETHLTATYGFARAVVDCPDFTPNADWTGVVRDAVYQRVLQAIRKAELELPAKAVAQAGCPMDLFQPGSAQVVTAYLRKQRPPATSIDRAGLFRTPTGSVSLEALRKRGGALWTLPPEQSVAVPPGFEVVKVTPAVAALLGELLNVRAADATDELVRWWALEAYLARTTVPLEAPVGACLPVEVSTARVRGFVGLTGDTVCRAEVDVIISDRLYRREQVDARLPLSARLAITEGADPVSSRLLDDARGWLTDAIRVAEQQLVATLAEHLDVPEAHDAVFRAFAASNTFSQPLRDLAIFPCTDGQLRPARTFDAQKKVRFVTLAIDGASSSGEPIVSATEPLVLKALSRWKSTEDVTASLQRELATRAARKTIPQVKDVKLPDTVLWRRPLTQDLEGEVGITAEQGGRVHVLFDRRPISTLDGALPAPLVARFNCETLTIGEGVVEDDAWKAVIARVADEAEALLERVADALSSDLGTRREQGPLLAPLAFWLVARKKRSAWLVRLPIFQTAAGDLVSLKDLLDEGRKGQAVQWSRVPGRPLNDDRSIWLPREGEREALAALKVNLKDVTPAIERANEVRNRRKTTDLTIAAAGPIQTLTTDRLQGQVGLHATPDQLLLIELHQAHTLLETFSTEHPVGAIARVNCDALTPNAEFNRANRNKVFKQVVSDVEDAVESLVGKRLEARQEGWLAFAEAAIAWRRPAKAIAALPLFTTLDGTKVTVGAAMEDQARNGRVLIAERGLKVPDDRRVLVATPDTASLLRKLQLKPEDITALLKKSVALEEGLQARRLASLKYDGDPLVRLGVNADGLKGELVICGAGETPGIVLAKDGIAVGKHLLGSLPIAGVVNVDGLEVDEGWTQAVVPHALRAKLDEAADPLFAMLAARADGQEAVRPIALAYLAHRGVKSPAHLERMSAAARALIAAPLFRTEDGQWVALQAIADQILRTSQIAIFEKAWRARDTGQQLVLRADSFDEPWIAALDALLGGVQRVKDVDQWRKQLAERDPDDDRGLSRLRMALRLLRAGALGHVTPGDLEDVRVRTGGLAAPITYDARRKLVLLDGDDPTIARALQEIPRRPERTWVLLAAIYGTVNRALEHITDDDEAALLLALARHLAANPKVLAPPETG